VIGERTREVRTSMDEVRGEREREREKEREKEKQRHQATAGK